jgi:uncharacterized protein
MKQVFADAFYWIASINPGDEWYDRTRAVTATLKQVQVVTIDAVFTEVLTFYSSHGLRMRQRTAQLVDLVMSDPTKQMMPQSRESFLAGLELYKNRSDKEYSLTDCIPMQVMRQLGITDVLTRDRHFTQEGFTILFNENV